MEVFRSWFYLVGVWALVGLMILSIVLNVRKFKIQHRWQELRAQTDKEILRRLEYLTEITKQNANLNMNIGRALIEPVKTGLKRKDERKPRPEHVHIQGQVFRPDDVKVTVGDRVSCREVRGCVKDEPTLLEKEEEEDCADVYHASEDHFPPYGTQSSEPPKK